MTLSIRAFIFTLHLLHPVHLHGDYNVSYTLNFSRGIGIRRITVYKGKLPKFDF